MWFKIQILWFLELFSWKKPLDVTDNEEIRKLIINHKK